MVISPGVLGGLGGSMRMVYALTVSSPARTEGPLKGQTPCRAPYLSCRASKGYSVPKLSASKTIPAAGVRTVMTGPAPVMPPFAGVSGIGVRLVTVPAKLAISMTP